MTVRTDKLLRMAEQIAVNVTASKDPSVIAERLADHLTRFWDPRMRAALTEHLADVDVAASDAVRTAIGKLPLRKC